MTFAEYLEQHKVESGLRDVLVTAVACLPKVAEAMRGGLEGHHADGLQNVFGEKQLKLDLIANDFFTQALTQNSHVAMVASEELVDSMDGPAGDEGFSVAYDPLDGSSLVDVNLAVGTIVGIYKGKGFIGRKGSQQVVAMIAVYGPRLTFMITVGNGVTEFIYDWGAKDFVVNVAEVKVAESKKMFAPGNLRACSDPSVKWYVDLMQHWLKNDYTLRYSGGMVPDVNQILKKGGGIFTYPAYSEMPSGKLRVLYECAPMAFLMEQAGGVAICGLGTGDAGGRILDLTLEKLDQRTPIIIGSKKEVALALKFFKA